MRQERTERIVLIGGGTGVSTIARSLKKYNNKHITSVHSGWDSGGHTGQLRRDFHTPPVGDMRQAMLALMDENVDPLIRKLWKFRFELEGSLLHRASVGNFILTALIQMCGGDATKAMEIACSFFRVQGTVLPVTTDDTHLFAELSDGSVLKGEEAIDTRSPHDDKTIKKVQLSPKAFLCPEVLQELNNADKKVICPSDLYTSIIPHFLVEGFSNAFTKSNGRIVYVVNLMTKKAETHKFSASDFAKTALEYLGICKFDVIICNNNMKDVNKTILGRYYEKDHSLLVKYDKENLQQYAHHVIADDLVDQSEGIIRHNSRTAEIIANL